MDSERWQKIKSVLEEVMEIDPASRSAFLEKSCNGDHDLCAEVESLLGFENDDADLLEESAFSIVTETSAENFIGKQIGRYKIISELGTGGMGVVFLATRADGEFQQQVALKLIKRGIGSDSILRRFVNERQILASLQHPNIAHLIDGGTTDDGLPYFVMEYVEGETILEFARRENLSIDARLDLFREVCAAVSFAHRNLVIHRDLKPSNILVTSDGKPKLLDFGIAKLLKTELTDQTVTKHFAFTPEYASPEQVRGENLTTATDIYSLGVILYELLTGARPFSFDGKNFGQIVQTVTQNEPPPPSAISNFKFRISDSTAGQTDFNPKSQIPNPKSLKGDLDNIILKSLKRDSERRYSSVEQFAEDIRRHLKGLPVLARQDTLFYRAEKFTRRNPLVVSAVAVAFLILIAGIAAVAWQVRIANAERAKAERRFNDVRRLANSFMFEINEEIEKSPIKARELLVTRAIEYLDKLAAESEGDADLQSELATAYEKIGNVQSELFKPSAGKTSDALLSHQKSLEIREKLFAAEPGNISRGLDAARSLAGIGDIFSMIGRVAEAAESYREAIRLDEQLLALDRKNVAVRRVLAGNYARLGQAVLRSGSLDSALLHYNKSLEIYQDLLAENPTDTSLQRSLSIIFSYIGYVKMEMGDTEQAVRFFSESLVSTEKYSIANADNQPLRSDLGNAHLWLGVSLSETANIEKSIFHLRRAVEIQTAIFESDKGNFGEQNALADSYLELGKALAIKAKTSNAEPLSAEAIRAYETAIKNYETVWQTDRQNFSAQRQIAFTRRHLADALQQKGETAKALQIFRETLKDFEELTQKDANNTEWQHDLAICNLRIGEMLSESGSKSEAAAHFEKALPMLEKLSADSPENIRIKRDLEATRRQRENL